MPTTFTDADAATVKLGQECIHQHHPELEQCDLTVTYLLAHNGTRAALKLHGYPCAAVIKITSYEQRVAGLDDVILKIDAAGWKEMSIQRQRAVMRHEFLHLTLLKEEDGSPKTDDCGRPRLKMRLHDVQLGIFERVIEEFGPDSLDAQMLDEAFRRPAVQGVLSWG